MIHFKYLMSLIMVLTMITIEVQSHFLRKRRLRLEIWLLKMILFFLLSGIALDQDVCLSRFLHHGIGKVVN